MANTDTSDYSLPKCNLKELLNKGPIRVPMIQRDYAQGRMNNTASDIRQRFVLSLIQAISDGKDLELDFIYGSNRRAAFEPLDGQQRITTLFLLHWMLGSEDLKDASDSSKLTYETRATSADFCNELVLHPAEQLRLEADKLAKEKESRIKVAEDALNELKESRPDEITPEYLKKLSDAEQAYYSAKSIPDVRVSDIITERDWFNYLWKYDPTIQSMLVMIDAIWEEMDWSSDLVVCRKNLEKITFSCLNLGEFGLSDELFIKMNARGKQLSEFDILKSSLEEEIQIQKQSGLCNSTIEARWRSLVDGEWIDWFWNKYAGAQIGAITEPKEEYQNRLSLSKVSEDYLKRLILRTITLQLLKTDNLEQSLLDISYDDRIWNLDWILSTYQESKRKVKKDPSLNKQVPNIQFDEIIKDITGLYFKDDNDQYHDVFSIIPERYNINPDRQDLSYLSLFLADSCPNDCKIVYYAIMQYVRVNPIEVENGDFKESWMVNFISWVRFCRNLTANDNNNIRIDTVQNTITALFGIDKLIESLNEYKNLPENAIGWTMTNFVSSLKSNFVGVDNQSLAEEVAKAKLSLVSSWNSELEKAEQDIYLWGQIRCLINWSENDLDKFKNYAEKLSSFIGFDDKNLLYAGILSIDSSYGFQGGRFYQWTNKDRDNSIKRYLRDNDIKEAYGFYAPILKEAIDKWTTDYNSLSLDEFLKECIRIALLEGPSYKWCILSMPYLLDNDITVYKRLFEHNGHYVLAQKKTMSSHCYDVALKYLYFIVEEKMEASKKYSDLQFFDSVGVSYQHALLFFKDGERILLREQPNGAYSLNKGDDEFLFNNETDMLNYMIQLCNIQ